MKLGCVLVTATYVVFLVVPAPAIYSSKEVLDFGTLRAQGMGLTDGGGDDEDDDDEDDVNKYFQVFSRPLIHLFLSLTFYLSVSLSLSLFLSLFLSFSLSLSSLNALSSLVSYRRSPQNVESPFKRRSRRCWDHSRFSCPCIYLNNIYYLNNICLRSKSGSLSLISTIYVLFLNVVLSLMFFY
jgi:hypothetical protein